MKTVFLALACLLGVHGKSLTTSSSSRGHGKQKPACCTGSKILSCQQFDLDPTAIGQPRLEVPMLGETLSYKGKVEAASNTHHYENNNVDLILTYNPERKALFGHAAMAATGESYTIEYCGRDVYVIKKLDIANLGDNIGVDYVDLPEGSSSGGMGRVKRQTPASDNTTIVTYSVKFYYTPQFAASTADIGSFIEQVVEETNQGYINSQVPLRVRALCSEQATIDDQTSASTMLSQFTSMKGSVAQLRDTADAAALLVNDFSACGIGYLNTFSSGTTTSVTAKNCALGYYSFGHELGHNFGLHHNTDVATNTAYPDGHGHLIAQGSATTGYRTILAYSATGHTTRVNYYSNPSVVYPVTGSATGVAGVSNNARVLTANRFSFSNVGDESSTACGASTTTQPPPSTTTPTPTTTTEEITTTTAKPTTTTEEITTTTPKSTTTSEEMTTTTSTTTTAEPTTTTEEITTTTSTTTTPKPTTTTEEITTTTSTTTSPKPTTTTEEITTRTSTTTTPKPTTTTEAITSTVSTSTAPSTTTEPNSCSVENEIRWYWSQFIGRVSPQSCMEKCMSSTSCLGWNAYSQFTWGRRVCYHSIIHGRKFMSVTSGPDLEREECVLNIDTDGCFKENSIFHITSKYITGSDAGECAESCAETDGCIQWRSGWRHCKLFIRVYQSRRHWYSGARHCEN